MNVNLMYDLFQTSTKTHSTKTQKNAEELETGLKVIIGTYLVTLKINQ